MEDCCFGIKKFRKKVSFEEVGEPVILRPLFFALTPGAFNMVFRAKNRLQVRCFSLIPAYISLMKHAAPSVNALARASGSSGHKNSQVAMDISAKVKYNKAEPLSAVVNETPEK